MANLKLAEIEETLGEHRDVYPVRDRWEWKLPTGDKCLFDTKAEVIAGRKMWAEVVASGFRGALGSLFPRIFLKLSGRRAVSAVELVSENLAARAAHKGQPAAARREFVTMARDKLLMLELCIRGMVIKWRALRQTKPASVATNAGGESQQNAARHRSRRATTPPKAAASHSASDAARGAGMPAPPAGPRTMAPASSTAPVAAAAASQPLGDLLQGSTAPAASYQEEEQMNVSEPLLGKRSASTACLLPAATPAPPAAHRPADGKPTGAAVPAAASTEGADGGAKALPGTEAAASSKVAAEPAARAAPPHAWPPSRDGVSNNEAPTTSHQPLAMVTQPPGPVVATPQLIADAARELERLLGMADCREVPLALEATKEHCADRPRWLDEAQVWLACQADVATEVCDLREAMKVSLQEAELQPKCELPLEAKPAEELVQRYKHSGLLKQLRGVVGTEVVFQPPLRSHCLSLCELERKCTQQWYPRSGAPAYFEAMGRRCAEEAAEAAAGTCDVATAVQAAKPIVSSGHDSHVNGAQAGPAGGGRERSSSTDGLATACAATSSAPDRNAVAGTVATAAVAAPLEHGSTANEAVVRAVQVFLESSLLELNLELARLTEYAGATPEIFRLPEAAAGSGAGDDDDDVVIIDSSVSSTQAQQDYVSV